MSAILGRIALTDRPLDPHDFEQAFGTLDAYGRDGRGTVVASHHALGLQRLDIDRYADADDAPLSLGPLRVAADAILDDRETLARKLNLDLGSTRASDARLIAESYRKWGAECTTHLFGDYAFAIHDTHTGDTFLARDHLGLRPLYWRLDQETLIFATDIRAIVAFEDVVEEIDEEAVASYLLQPLVPLVRHFLKGVRVLEPGHRLVVAKGNAKTSRWWDPRSLPDVRYRRTDDYVEALGEIVTRSVAQRVATDHPVGSHLSGGIDSSTVTTLATKALTARGQNLAAAYSWSPPFGDAYPDMGARDERHLIEQTAAAGGYPVRYSRADGGTLYTYLQRPVEYVGVADLYEEVSIVEQAKKDGVRVMLSGWGGDEAFSALGFGYLAHQLSRGRLLGATRTAMAFNKGSRRPSKLAVTFWDHGLLPLMPDWAFNRLSPYAEQLTTSAFIKDSFLDRYGALERRQPLRLIPAPRKYLEDLLLWGHLSARADSWAAQAAGAGIQYRYPLLERRLVEFCLGLPFDLFTHDGRTRFMSRAVSGGLFELPRSKSDKANATMRRDNFGVCWDRLANRYLGQQCAEAPGWIDAEAFKAALSSKPARITSDDLPKFRRIMDTTTIWNLYERQVSDRNAD